MTRADHRAVLILGLGLTTWLGGLVADSASAGADDPVRTLEEGLARLWGNRPPPAPSDLASLTWKMALDPDVEEDVISRADAELRPLTHDLLAMLEWTEPEALRALPDLHVVRMGGPPPGERPPTWGDVRWAGLRLLRQVAAPDATGRDHRLQRELDQALDSMPRRTPSEVGGLVVLWQSWWADRGADPSFYLDPELVPTVDDWLASLSPAADDSRQRTMLEMTLLLADDPLRRNLLLERLDPGRHAHLVAEAMEILSFYKQDFDERDIPFRQWDPDQGRHVGYRPWDLRAAALDVLDRVSGRMGSGVDEHTLVLDWLYWWQRARFQARYYRDPLAAPTLEPWLANLDRSEAEGGRSTAGFLRELYLAANFRDLLLEQLALGHQGLVADLIEWLRKDEKSAIAAGFEVVHRRFPLRPQPGEEGLLMTISWEQVQVMIRDLLRLLTGEQGLGEPNLPADQIDAFWQDWWRIHRRETRWHRGGVVTERSDPRSFMPERARAE